MAETFALAAEKREISKHSARNTRREYKIPGVVYGHGLDPVPVSVDYSEFLRLFRKAGQSSVIDLTIDGKATKVLVQKYDLDPVKDTFVHVDFFAVNLKEKTIVRVPLHFEGESMAVKNLGGIFNVAHHELEIRCLPTEIPHDIKVDISSLENVHDHISIADLNLSETLEVMHLEAGTVLCTVTAARVAVEEETTAGGEEGEGAEGADGGEAKAEDA